MLLLARIRTPRTDRCWADRRRVLVIAQPKVVTGTGVSPASPEGTGARTCGCTDYAPDSLAVDDGVARFRRSCDRTVLRRARSSPAIHHRNDEVPWDGGVTQIPRCRAELVVGQVGLAIAVEVALEGNDVGGPKALAHRWNRTRGGGLHPPFEPATALDWWWCCDCRVPGRRLLANCNCSRTRWRQP